MVTDVDLHRVLEGLKVNPSRHSLALEGVPVKRSSQLKSKIPFMAGVPQGSAWDYTETVQKRILPFGSYMYTLKKDIRWS